jgi:hypothetical protein
MLTQNEKKVIRLLLFSQQEHQSVNHVASECSLSPNGAHKILTKLEREGILKVLKVANIRSYRIDFTCEKTRPTLELALITQPDKRIKARLGDLKDLRPLTKVSIIFGSYVSAKDPDDLDLFFLIDKVNYRRFSNALEHAKEIIPVRLHDVLQTEVDLKKNIVSKDPVVLDILRYGIVAWGQDHIVRVMADVYR